jgi:hypothetical protein
MINWGCGIRYGDYFPGVEAYKNQQNLKNEIGILKSYSLNLEVMNQLPEFHVEYIAVGKRGFAEQRMYSRSPFKVIYDSLNKQLIGQKVSIKYCQIKNTCLR